MKNEILALINQIEDWNTEDKAAFIQIGAVQFDNETVFQERQNIIEMLVERMKPAIVAAPILEEIIIWNAGDWETYLEWGDVGFDGSFVFQARQAKINQLRDIAKKF